MDLQKRPAPTGGLDDLYRSPTSDVEGPKPTEGEPTDAEAVRKAHLNHETSVKSVAWLYLLGIAGTLYATYLIATVPGAAGVINADPTVTIAIYLIFALVFGAVAMGLRKLAEWSRIGSSILAALGMLQFPIGTIINGYIVYLMISKKGRMVFSAEYRDIINRTPHIKYRTSTFTKVVLGVLLLILVGMAMMAVANV